MTESQWPRLGLPPIGVWAGQSAGQRSLHCFLLLSLSVVRNTHMWMWGETWGSLIVVHCHLTVMVWSTSCLSVADKGNASSPQSSNFCFCASSCLKICSSYQWAQLHPNIRAVTWNTILFDFFLVAICRKTWGLEGELVNQSVLCAYFGIEFAEITCHSYLKKFHYPIKRYFFRLWMKILKQN